MIVTPKDIEDRIQTDLNCMIELFRSHKLDGNRAMCGIAAIASLRALQSEISRKQEKFDSSINVLQQLLA